MAQLIKLRDYISRYEWNTYHYPSQYIRLKRDQWSKRHDLWKMRERHDLEPFIDNESRFSKLKSLIRKKNKNPKELHETDLLPETELELKQYFLDELYPVQLKWAMSTVSDISFCDKKYQYDPTLKYLLQRFPDIYFVMYYPIFNIRKAPIESEIILISPLGIDIICVIEDELSTTYIADDDRTWIMEQGEKKKTKINPIISLKRTEQIIKSILSSSRIDYPIKKIVLSRTNNILFSTTPYQTKIIGKNEYKEWFNEKRKLSSPLKNQQLRVAKVLLKHCLTTSVKRPEWENNQSFYTTE